MTTDGPKDRSSELADLLSGVALGTLSVEETAKLERLSEGDKGLSDQMRNRRELHGLLAHAAPARSAPSVLRARLLASVRESSPFSAFVAELQQLFDLGRGVVQELLASAVSAASWEAGPVRGIELFHLDGGPRVAAADAGFVRMAPGTVFPLHRHLGPEVVLVLAGSYLDSSGVRYGVGDLVSLPEGSEHSFTADPVEGVVFAVVVSGVDILG